MIDYARLAEALGYYAEAGFKQVEAPWIVGHDAYYATKPLGALDFLTLGGYLAASAEQSFLQLMMSGYQLGRSVALTPCFRHEEYDRLHHPYFMKVELINAENVSGACLTEIIDCAQGFYERFVATRVESMPAGSFDIVEATTGIELGSYGRRRTLGYQWLYGTGLAEPRLTQVIEVAKNT